MIFKRIVSVSQPFPGTWEVQYLATRPDGDDQAFFLKLRGKSLPVEADLVTQATEALQKLANKPDPFEAQLPVEFPAEFANLGLSQSTLQRVWAAVIVWVKAWFKRGR